MGNKKQYLINTLAIDGLFYHFCNKCRNETKSKRNS